MAACRSCSRSASGASRKANAGSPRPTCSLMARARSSWSCRPIGWMTVGPTTAGLTIALGPSSRRSAAPFRAPSISSPIISIAATMPSASTRSPISPGAAATPLVAGNDVHYHEPERRLLQDVLTGIREGCTVAEAGHRLAANAERHLKPPAEMARLFRRHPEALARTVEIAERCRFSLDELRYEYPDRARQAGRTPQQELAHLAWRGARRRYPRRRAGEGARAASSASSPHRRARLRALFPHRPRHRALRQGQAHPVPGPRLGGQFGGVLLPRHHRGRSRRASTCCSSASSAPRATSRPTSTSISSMSGARR